MTNPAIVRDVLDNGLRLLTETMTQVRSVSIGVWLTRGSRHETADRGGIAHFVEHMLFKGTTSRSAEDIAQAIDSIGGQLDAFTAKEYASYYIKVLDEHLPLAIDILSDIVRNPAFTAEDIEREKKVVVEEIKMVEDTPDDLVHELFTQGFWENHALGRPILGTRDTVESFDVDLLRSYFVNTYTPRNLIVSAVGNIQHARVRQHRHPAAAQVDAVPGQEVVEVLPDAAVRVADMVAGLDAGQPPGARPPRAGQVIEVNQPQVRAVGEDIAQRDRPGVGDPALVQPGGHQVPPRARAASAPDRQPSS